MTASPVTETNASHRVWFLGEPRYYNSLLDAMERYQTLRSVGVHDVFVHIEKRTKRGWVYFDAERFLDGMTRLLAPAE